MNCNAEKACINFKCQHVLRLIFFRWSVRLGDVDLSSEVDDGAVVEREVLHLSIHSNFHRGQAYFDVAVLTVSEVTFATYVRPICLPAPSFDEAEYDDRAATVTGWGSENRNSSTSPTLKRAQVEIYDME